MSEQQKNCAVITESEKKKEDWMNSKWRPMMGWMYMLVCITDFILFPILWSTIQALAGGQVHSQWQPITLAGAGLFHVAMGAVLGIAAFGRTQEKLNGVNHSGQVSNFSTPSGVESLKAASYSASINQQPLGNGAQQYTSFNSSTPIRSSRSNMPIMSKPMPTWPIDDDYMPPRE